MAEEKNKASSEIKLVEDEDLKKVQVTNLHSASDPGTVKITQTTTIKSSSDTASTEADATGGKVTVTTTTTTSSASTSEAKAEGGDGAKTSIVDAIKSAVENPKIETVTTTTTSAEGAASSEAKPGLDSSVLVLTTTVAEPKTETVTTTTTKTINTSSEAGSTENKENPGINVIAETLTSAAVQPKTQETVTVTTYSSSETAKPTGEANTLAEVITKAVEEPKKQETVTVTKIESSTAEKPTALVTSVAVESQKLSEEKPAEDQTTITVTKVDAEPEPANKQENTTVTTTTTTTVVEPKKEEIVKKIVTSVAGKESAEPQKEEEKPAQVKTITTTTTTSAQNVTPTEAEAKTDSAASGPAKNEENTTVTTTTTTTSLTNEPNTASNKETVTLTNLPDEDSDIEEIKKSLNTIATSIPNKEEEDEEAKKKVETAAVAPPKKKTPKDNIPLKALIILKKIHLDDNLLDEKNFEENEDDEIIEPVYILPNEYLSRLQPIKNGPKIGVQQPKHQEFSYQPYYPTIASNKPQETHQTYGSSSANQPQDLYYNELYSSTRRNEPQAQYYNGFYQPSNNTQSQVQYYGNQYQYQDPYKYAYPTENGKAKEEIKTSQISPKKYNILSPAFTYNEDPNPQRKQLIDAQQTSPIISTKPNAQLQIAPQIELQNNVYSYDSTPVYKSDPYSNQTSQLNDFYSGYSSNGNSMPDRTNIIDEIVAKIQKDEANSLNSASKNPDPYQYASNNQNAFQNLTSLPDEFVIYKTKPSSELSYALVEENLIKEATPNKIEEIFQDIDADGTGKITPQSLWTILQTVNAKFNKSYTFADAQSFFYALDSNSDGQLDLEEFTRAFKYAAESINNFF